MTERIPPGYIVLNEGGQRYVKYVPVCPVHGRMPRVPAIPPQVAWECCGNRIDAANLPWIPFEGDVPPPPFMPRPRSGQEPLS